MKKKHYSSKQRWSIRLGNVEAIRHTYLRPLAGDVDFEWMVLP